MFNLLWHIRCQRNSSLLIKMMACTELVPGHHTSQWWILNNWTPGIKPRIYTYMTKFKWIHFFQQNTFENTVSRISANLFRNQCVRVRCHRAAPGNYTKFYFITRWWYMITFFNIRMHISDLLQFCGLLWLKGVIHLAQICLYVYHGIIKTTPYTQEHTW